MIRLASALAAFSAAAVGAGLARGLTTAYLPVLLERIRDAPGWIGTVMLVNTLAGLVVPLAVGVWSDRLRARGHTRTLPFVLGGTVLAAGGLAAIALGHASSYAALALCAAVAYTGINAVTTAHRALIPETFAGPSQAAATGSEEVALLLGGLAGIVAGGLLLELAPWAPFAFGAAVLPLLAAPTALRRRDAAPPARRGGGSRLGLRYYARAARRPGARLVLLAQVLWVGGYVGLTPFFVLFAEREVGLRPAVAAVLLAGFGTVAGAAMLAAARVPARLWPHCLVAGAAAMAGGFALAAPAASVASLAAPLALAAAGFGLVTTLGFSAYARWIPPGEEGGYTALYLAARAAAALVALPLTGWAIAVAETYRAALAVGAAAAALALAPLLVLALGAGPRRRAARLLGLAGASAGVVAALLGGGLLAAETSLAAVDERLFRALLGLGGTPRLLDATLVDPHIHNYVALTLVAAVSARLLGGSAPRTALFVALAGTLSFAAVRVLWALWDRPRPQDLLGDVGANGHDWSPYASFPSGHVAVTAAIAVAAARVVPRLAVPLALYLAVITLTRVTYGAHFPSDVVGGLVLGALAAVGAAVLLRELGVACRWLGRDDFGRLRRLLERRRLLAAARGWSVAASILFFVLLATMGPPHGPEGGMLSWSTEHWLNRTLLDVVVVAAAVAWLWHAAGGAALVVIAVAIGALARVEYTPEAALLACLAFFVPGVLYLLASHAVSTPRRRAAVAAGAVGLLALGGFAAERVHAAVYGPSHPESPLEPLPASAVEWLWAGALGPTGVTVSAKLEDDGTARLLVAERASLAGATASQPRRAEEDVNDRTVALRVDGLRPGRRYHYAVEVDGVPDRTRQGSFRTLPPAGPASFTVALGSCARTGSSGAVFDAIRAERPLLFLVLGDLFYGNIDEPSERRFRAAYAATLTAPAQAALYRTTPVAYVWDDHDYGPNDGDRSSPSRATAQRVYRELVPHYPLVAGGTGPIQQAFTVGRVRFLLTDSRSERVPGRTMLGQSQKRWLVQELSLARRRDQLAVWVSSVPWIGPAEEGADDWAGYAAERRELADAARGGAVLMLAGDAHMLAVDDGSHSGYGTPGGRGFPVMHAAALDRPGGTKGGPYSEGAVGGSGQFGTLRVDDDGHALRVTLTGRRHDGGVVLRYAYEVVP